MKKNFYFSKIVFITVIILGLFGCNNKNTTDPADKKEISIAVTEISEVSLKAAENEFQKRGFKEKLILVDSNISVLKSVNDGSVDAAMAVHKPFMEKFNKENNGDLVMVQPYTYYTGIGLYSEKYKSLDEIPQKARISIMNDAMNMDKGLRMLEDAGLITLDKGKEGAYTIIDIKDNPKNIEIIEMDQAQTVKSLSELDAAVVFFTHMRNAGKDYTAYLFRDQDAKEYPIALVVKKGNENAPWAAALAESLKSEESVKVINEYFGGVFTIYEN
jgi:D-methionine transport system substrate-binding protein